MAEEHKKSFMLYFDNFPCVAALDAEQRGELLLLLYRYAMAADKAPTDPEEVLRQHPGLREETRMAYRFLAETIRRDTEKWKEKQRRYQEAAAQVGGILAHGDGVHIHDAVQAVVLILQAHPVLDGAHVGAERQLAAGLDAAENSLFGRSICFHNGFPRFYRDWRTGRGKCLYSQFDIIPHLF